jgi:chaperonin GroES
VSFKPLYDRIVVKKAEEADKTPGGIIIPDSAKEKQSDGVVIALGEGRLLMDGSVRPMPLSVGDHVMFGKYSGTEISVDGEKLLLLREDDIIGVTS